MGFELVNLHTFPRERVYTLSGNCVVFASVSLAEPVFAILKVFHFLHPASLVELVATISGRTYARGLHSLAAESGAAAAAEWVVLGTVPTAST